MTAKNWNAKTGNGEQGTSKGNKQRIGNETTERARKWARAEVRFCSHFSFSRYLVHRL